MSVTLESVERINALKNGIEATTGETYNDLTEAVQGLKDGYGQGGGGDDQLAGLLDGTATEISNSKVTSLRENAFFSHKTLVSVDFPSVKKIGPYAFNSCTSLVSVSIDAATYIDSYAFGDCPELAITSLPPNLTHINDNAFRNCSKLAITSIPSGVKTISMAAFYRCSGLTILDLPHSVYNIGGSAFQNCTALKTIVLRKSDGVCYLGNKSAFNGTPFASGGTGGTVYVPGALIETYRAETNWSTLYAAGTCNFVAIEGSEYE